MGRALTLLAGLIVAISLIGWPALLEAEPSSAEADVARRVLSALADEVVDVAVGSSTAKEVPHPLSPGTSTDIALRPTSGWNGICEARVLTFDVPEDAATAPSANHKHIEFEGTRTEYKVRGDLDQNQDQDEGFAAVCARDLPLKDGYFAAPDGRTAQEAGLIVEAARRAASVGQRFPQLSCGPPSDCHTERPYLAGASADRLFAVTEVTPCPDNRSCLELSFWNDDHCARTWSVVARYHGVGRKGWGLLQVERLRLGPEDCPRLR
jgi:hypothetical protein